ncbi:MAG: AraC family transcriptional regulator [Chloroflexi bacterium]|nr:AraC family transcriptional regulator [Chloroflexota bacterium]
MHAVDLMAQALDFIEAHLCEDIAVGDIAAAVSYSVYHFCRTFNQVTHHTPYDYLMRRRLAEAACELLQTDRKIIDLAYAYQFNNPETFSRAFKRVFDAQPNQFRKQGGLPWPGLMPRLTLAHLEQIAKGPYLKPIIVERDALQLAGVMTLVHEVAANPIELWQIFAAALRNHGGLAATDVYGLTLYPANADQSGIFYMLGTPVTDLDALKAAWVVKTLPARQYVRFIHKGLQRDLPLTLDYAYHTWLPQSARPVAAPHILARYAPGYEDSAVAECEIYLPVA